MLITYGVVDFSVVQFDYSKYESNPEQFVKFGTNTLFPFVILTSGVASSATMEVLDINGDTVSSGISLTVTDNEDAKQLSYAGTTLTGMECGHYLLKITHGSDVYYSEFFEWADDLTEFAKLTISPYKILVLNHYEINLSSYTFIQYFKTADSYNGRILDTSPETIEDGVSKNYGDELLKSTVNFENEIELIGNDASFKFLAMIRPSAINGTVIFEYNSRQKTIYNTTVEQSENSKFGEKIIIKFTFMENYYISNSNTSE